MFIVIEGANIESKKKSLAIRNFTSCYNFIIIISISR